jgi:hypothetical protein
MIVPVEAGRANNGFDAGFLRRQSHFSQVIGLNDEEIVFRFAKLSKGAASKIFWIGKLQFKDVDK